MFWDTPAKSGPCKYQGLAGAMWLLLVAPAIAVADTDLQFYQTQVLPILRSHCLDCHSHAAGKARGGLVLDSRTAILRGGDSGPAIVPEDVPASLLVEAIGYESDAVQMPPAGKLPAEKIAVLVEWVRRGAPAPDSSLPERTTPAGEQAEQHWAFEPLQSVAVPGTVETGSDAIDFLVSASRATAGVTPVGPADSGTILRRVYLDLIGLPPTPADLAAFSQRVTDSSAADALSEVVDDLLRMPEFGERWGRHWLDAARYADSNGCSIESNNTYDNAWRYRDYVISAWNHDKPYDRFVVEQVAGDLLDYVSSSDRCEQLIATGFLLLGPKAFGTSSFEQLRLDVVDEQIDTIGKAMLGMSLGCARCHDHKFDPVSTEDYYALAGIFSSTESVRRAKGWRQSKTWHRVKLPVLDEEAERALLAAHEETKQAANNGELKKQAEKRLQAAQAAMAKAEERSEEMAAARVALEAAQREMKNAANMAKVFPVISPLPAAMAVSDVEAPVDEAVRVRGEPENRGSVVPRHVLSLFGEAEEFAVPEGESGRLQLARWLVDSDEGAGQLLARVAANRVWGHLFARPLVGTADNFGLTGEAPTHPELLDYLANRLIENGWSMKSLIRDIVLTKTYSLAPEIDAHHQQVDPANIWLWRYHPKRIDVEVLRDSLLAISGQLDRSRGGKTLQHLGLVSLGGDHLVLDRPSPYLRRSVYIPIYRDAIGLTDEIDRSMGMLSTFDFADPNLMAGLRPQTVVPAQALFLMNGEFIYEQAGQIADRLLQDGQLQSDAERIDYLLRSVYGRPAAPEERAEFEAFLSEFVASSDGDQPEPALEAWTSLCQAVVGSNEFLFQD